ncbi:hypothetical protein CHS0354_008224 [Potamilus streckersoni]|uniref:Uncharacterized protein n=1 Tax=Potamilus streckersoni TaxID=2493646 RepID=A0AAE0RX67_9BIVA|nr:hypothetical protein CHS0354_008224 [Potamilus streckersoni]
MSSSQACVYRQFTKRVHPRHINQVYMMNISKYPHPWRSEQSHYEKIKQKKMIANQIIREKVITQDVKH